MTRNEFKKVYKSWYGETYCAMFWKAHREELMEMNVWNFTASEVLNRGWIEPNYIPNGLNYEDNMKVLQGLTLGNCTAATPVEYTLTCTRCATPATNPLFPSENISYGEAWINQEKGNNPMRTSYEYNTPTASATVINAKSDEAYQREYLLDELARDHSWSDPKYGQLRKLFNIGTSNEPETAEELIEKITNKQFKLDEKKMARLKASKDRDSDYDDDCDCEYTGGVFYGIIWDGIQPDRKGYDAAVNDYDKAKADTKRKIIVGSPAEGLQALLDLEAWLPTGKAN